LGKGAPLEASERGTNGSTGEKERVAAGKCGGFFSLWKTGVQKRRETLKRGLKTLETRGRRSKRKGFSSGDHHKF